MTTDDGTAKFPLSTKGKTATIWVDENDYRVTSITSQMLADDVMRVTGTQALVKQGKSLKDIDDETVFDADHGGLKVPDDVTMLWSDDKQGFMRNLCNPEEMNRMGGAGIYYHLSYHGDSDSWFWLSPLSPALISAELTKSHEYGARNIWVFNVSDIKPAEKELSLAMEMASIAGRLPRLTALLNIGLTRLLATLFRSNGVSSSPTKQVLRSHGNVWHTVGFWNRIKEMRENKEN